MVLDFDMLRRGCYLPTEGDLILLIYLGTYYVG